MVKERNSSDKGGTVTLFRALSESIFAIKTVLCYDDLDIW